MSYKTMFPLQDYYTFGMSLFLFNSVYSILSHSSLFSYFIDRFLDHKLLCNTHPISLDPFPHLRTRPNFSRFQPPMPFIHLLVVLKFTPFNPFILEKFS